MNPNFSHVASFIADLKSVEQLIAQNQLPHAATRLNQLVQQAPHDPRLFLLGARLAEASNNPQGTLAAAKKAVELAPHWPTACVYLAEVMASQGDGQGALTMASFAVQLATDQNVLDAEILTKAAAAARAMGAFAPAATWLQAATELHPTDVSTRYKLGLVLYESGDFTQAIEKLTQVLEQTPGNPGVLRARMQAALSARVFELAKQDCEALLTIDSSDLELPYFMAIARGETPPTQPSSLVSALFDSLASGYDQRTVVQSRYMLPRDVAKMIHDWYPDKSADVLDLGSGTGLLGVCLAPTQGVIVGVDLSEQMTAQAIRHGVYAKFHTVNLLDALNATPDAQYDVIAALDVFGYVGALDQAIPNAHRILLPNGRLVFSCETSEANHANYALQPTFRYTHARGYVEDLLVASGFVNIDIQNLVIRTEDGLPVAGFLVTAQKASQNA